MRNIIHIIIYMLAAISFAAILVGCGNEADNRQLVDIDTLLAQNQAEDALLMLNAINTSSYNNKERAYYDLLTTQANHDCRIAATNDSNINGAVK